MKTFRNIAAALFVATLMLTGCLKESFPTSSITEQQLATSSNALAALSHASAAALNTYGSDYSNFGYPGIMFWRDVMAAEIPIYATDYDYHSYYTSSKYLGNFLVQSEWWSLLYKVVLNSNLIISSAGDNPDASVAHTLGNALCYRAFAYFDLARMYEYQKTGFEELDAEAENRGIFGLTVPIYTEKTTEKESTNLPRAPFYALFRFIMTDLNKAETLLEGYTSSSVNAAGETLVYGLKARVWLDLASRFNPDVCSDAAHYLSDMIAGENEYPEYDKLGVTTALECYEKAAYYANLAKAGHTPLTKEQWYDKTTGFNKAQDAWIFGMTIGDEDVVGSWKSFTGNMSPETTYGTANSKYSGFRMIDKALYGKIGKNDWRKNTWLAPGDAKKSSAYSKYSTNLSEEKWLECPAYSNFKFHPGQGNMDNYLVGNAVDIPLMRVEEMYLIEAEAKAYTEGLASGTTALMDFVNTYRYTDGSYSPSLSDMNGFLDEILTQRRIELWGEGVVIFDYRRLKKAVLRGYKGTNHPTSYRNNSRDGGVPPWSTVYITSSEYQFNHGFDGQNNPDPSGISDLYVE